MNVVEVKNISTRFGKKLVHDNISFDIKQGEIFGILGSSGSGKTVLLKQLVMLNQIQKGSVEILSKDIKRIRQKDLEKLKREFSYLFQFGALFSFLNVIENISVMLKEYTSLPDDVIENIAYTNLNIAGLKKESAFLYPSQISGGMRKKVALARSLAFSPKILFLDEPTSGLDPASTEEVNKLLLFLRDELKMTIIIITHDLDTIKNMLDRFIIINGKKIFDGTIEEAQSSDNEFIKDFLKNKGNKDE
ncbi:putative ABC transporter ATP-binding protein [Aliarcobacter thereius]|uniref:ABC transporter ATP-binding protein n=1 Tax=Aliarcobacter thereius TaxID=544718 RepID=UPI000828B0A8|nr:ATP-binding cassette domain-containing protein [Aliarcobacter thereius]OCL88522.1 putative ABC transporter ATP-binding protein [Aliarcobacter thereius]